MYLVEETLDLVWQLQFVGVTESLGGHLNVLEYFTNLNARVFKSLRDILKTNQMRK
jgi:hypothetical protein